VQEFAFGDETGNFITFPDDQIAAKDSTVHDSAGQLRYAVEHRWQAGSTVGWEASWFPGGQLHSLKHFDRQGFLSGYAITYFENGKVESAGRYATNYFHYCRTSNNGKTHAYIVDHNTRREGPWRYYKSDGTLLREEPGGEIIDHGYGGD
jgi:antitoxin component YwqK of YwqJK toxin-antitoxin module